MSLNDFEYHSPASLKDACALLKKYAGKGGKGSARLLAGGTDLIPKMYQHQLAPKHVINIKNIPDLDKIAFDNKSGLSLGALVKFNEIIYSEDVRQNYPILVEVSKKIASHQIRNLATVGGNLCNAAPSADSAPILIALDSAVTLAGPGGKKRTIPLEQFFKGPGKTALGTGEILTQIQVPPIQPRTGMEYIKHTIRNALEIAVVGVAVLVQIETGSDKCNYARIVIGACAPTPVRVPAAEQQLEGKVLDEIRLAAAADAAAEEIKPITDVRAHDSYRREMVKVQCKRALEQALAKAQSIRS